MNLDPFTRHYLICALWSSTDNSTPQGGEPLDRNYCIDDIAPAMLQHTIDDCAKFQRENAQLLEQAYAMPGYAGRGDGYSGEECAGHDFWLTRCGHGAGFWDRGLGEVGDTLTKACKAFGNVDLYVGDDGFIYSCP
jgi:hypothetical protein